MFARLRSTTFLGVALLLVSCLRPSEHHERLDERVGMAEVEGLRIDSDGSLAIRSVTPQEIVLWAGTPRLRLSIEGITVPLRLRVMNTLPDSLLVAGGTLVARENGRRRTEGLWTLDPSMSGEELIIESADAELPIAHAVAVLSDIQEAVDNMADIVDRLNQDEIRYVVSTGDLTNNGTREEIIRFQLELERLDVPFYSTVGNHETPGPENWHEYFGPFSGFFTQHGVAVSLVDSSNATIDPDLHARMLEFANTNVETLHLFLTHTPLLDASGFRSGAFRSRNEAARIIQELSARRVDAIFFGHVHSYYAYSLGDVPTYISGGGGAIQERLDGIERHYLRVNLVPDAESPIDGVTLIRVD
ncbi:MAG: Icc protein [Polyangiales bacterium]|jgi:Icc protein